MLDLVEGAKIINALPATTQGTTGVYADWVNTENMHVIWAICTFDGGTTAPAFTPSVAEDYTGTSSSSEVGVFYTNLTSTTLDRWTKSTATTGLAMTDGAVEQAMAIRFDPAAVASSSNKFFSVYCSSCDGPISVTYIAEPRYAGSQQFIATTSST
jgi:hypothetical protein